MIQELYKDFYGFTYRVLVDPQTGRTHMQVKDGIRLLHSKTYKTYRGAKIALGILSDSTFRLKERKNIA